MDRVHPLSHATLHDKNMVYVDCFQTGFNSPWKAVADDDECSEQLECHIQENIDYKGQLIVDRSDVFGEAVENASRRRRVEEKHATAEYLG